MPSAAIFMTGHTPYLKPHRSGFQVQLQADLRPIAKLPIEATLIWSLER